MTWKKKPTVWKDKMSVEARKEIYEQTCVIQIGGKEVKVVKKKYEYGSVKREAYEFFLFGKLIGGLAHDHDPLAIKENRTVWNVVDPVRYSRYLLAKMSKMAEELFEGGK